MKASELYVGQTVKVGSWIGKIFAVLRGSVLVKTPRGKIIKVALNRIKLWSSKKNS